MKKGTNLYIVNLIILLTSIMFFFIFESNSDNKNAINLNKNINNDNIIIKSNLDNKNLCTYNDLISFLYFANNISENLDFKILYFCYKYKSLELFNDIKETIKNEIGSHNYYKDMKTRMSIISYTNDIGTCQFQHKTFYWLSDKYGLKNADIHNENHQIEIMVQAFKNGNQNLWMGYKKYKKNINK
jgi:hypothetical protein